MAERPKETKTLNIPFTDNLTIEQITYENGWKVAGEILFIYKGSFGITSHLQYPKRMYKVFEIDKYNTEQAKIDGLKAVMDNLKKF